MNSRTQTQSRTFRTCTWQTPCPSSCQRHIPPSPRRKHQIMHRRCLHLTPPTPYRFLAETNKAPPLPWHQSVLLQETPPPPQKHQEQYRPSCKSRRDAHARLTHTLDILVHCGVEHSASVIPVRTPPLQTVRADFPHTASRVKLVSSVIPPSGEGHKPEFL